MPGDLFLLKTERRAGNVVLDKLVAILDSFDAEEDDTEKHGENEAADEQRAASGLRGPNRENHGQAATDEYYGIGGAQRHVDGFAGGGEVGEIPAAVDQVGAEQAAEE